MRYYPESTATWCGVIRLCWRLLPFVDVIPFIVFFIFGEKFKMNVHIPFPNPPIVCENQK